MGGAPRDRAATMPTTRDGLVIAAIFGAVALKNIDKQLIGLLKPLLDREFHWTDIDYGHIAALSQLIGALCLPFAGVLVDRVRLNRIFPLAVLLWSAATIAQAAVYTFLGLLLCRLCLSASESLGTPAALRCATTYVSRERRGLAVGSINLAASLAAVLAPLLVPLIAAPLGWRTATMVAGLGGVAWLIFWYALPLRRFGEPQQVPLHPDAGIWRDHSAWLLIAAKTCTDQLWWFTLYWLPDLLERQYSRDPAMWGGAVMAGALLAALGSLIAPLFVRRRRATLLIAWAVALTPIVAAQAGQLFWVAAIFGLGLMGHQILSTMVFLRMCEAPFERTTGTLVGVGAFCSHLLAAMLMAMVGAALARGISYGAILACLGALYALGAMAITALHRLRPASGTRAS